MAKGASKKKETAEKAKESGPVTPKEITGLSTWERMKQPILFLWEPEDASWLAFYRIFWGMIMFMEVFHHVERDFGKMYMSWYLSPFLFKYPYFEWVGVPDPAVCKVFLITMLVACVLIIIGWHYRVASIYFAIGFSWMFFAAQGTYLNHFYLVMLIAILLVFLPANNSFSVDAFLNPNAYKPTVPKICLLSLRLFQAIVYFYAGVAKINEDWLRAEPLRHWLPKRHGHAFIGWLLTRESTAYFMSYSGMIYDLLVGFMLMWEPTLLLGILSTLFFHLSNRYIFNIGIFPFVMITSTTLYLEPDICRRIAHLIFSKRGEKYKPVAPPVTVRSTKIRKMTWKEVILTTLAILFIAHQALTPLRYHVYGSNVVWDELGHRYSWRMKLRDKMCDSFFWFYAKDEKVFGTLDPTKTIHERQAGKMQSRPDMVAQFTNYAAKTIKERSGRDVEIYSYISCRLNFRDYHMLVNSTFNMANVDPNTYNLDWVVPLPPLPEKYYSEYPWNWEWNFNWLFGVDRDTLQILREDYQQHRDQNRLKNLFKNETQKVLQFLADRDADGDVSKFTVFDDMPALLNRVV